MKEVKTYDIRFNSNKAGVYQGCGCIMIPMDNLNWFQRKLWHILGAEVVERMDFKPNNL